MIESSAEYNNAVTATARRTYLRAIVDIISTPSAYGSITGADQASYSKPEQTHDLTFDVMQKFSTLELNRILLDGSYDPLPEETDAQIGYVGAALSGSDGSFETAQVINLPIEGLEVLKAFSLYFSDNPMDGVAKSVKIEIMSGDTAVHTKEVSDNTASSIVQSNFYAESPTAIRITVYSWTLPRRRVRIIEILPGLHDTWGSDMLVSFTATQQTNFSGVTLPYGTCTLEIDNSDEQFEPRNKSGVFKSLEERHSIAAQIGIKLPSGAIEYKPIGKFYHFSGGWSTGNNGLTIQWDFVDILGLITDRTFFPPETLPTTLSGWVASIMSTLGEDFADQYIISAGLADMELTATDVSGKKCGDLLASLAMAASAWCHADAETGKVAIETLPSAGKSVTLGNLTAYPTTSANSDVGKIVFNLADGAGTQVVFDGNDPASSGQITIDNPFIHTAEAAQTAAAYVLSFYGGNLVTTDGRGDPASEVGDLDTIELAKGNVITGRRQMQSFVFNGGVMRGCQSKFLEVDA